MNEEFFYKEQSQVKDAHHPRRLKIFLTRPNNGILSSLTNPIFSAMENTLHILERPFRRRLTKKIYQRSKAANEYQQIPILNKHQIYNSPSSWRPIKTNLVPHKIEIGKPNPMNNGRKPAASKEYVSKKALFRDTIPKIHFKKVRKVRKMVIPNNKQTKIYKPISNHTLVNSKVTQNLLQIKSNNKIYAEKPSVLWNDQQMMETKNTNKKLNNQTSKIYESFLENQIPVIPSKLSQSYTHTDVVNQILLELHGQDHDVLKHKNITNQNYFLQNPTAFNTTESGNVSLGIHEVSFNTTTPNKPPVLVMHNSKSSFEESKLHFGKHDLKFSVNSDQAIQDTEPLSSQLPDDAPFVTKFQLFEHKSLMSNDQLIMEANKKLSNTEKGKENLKVPTPRKKRERLMKQASQLLNNFSMTNFGYKKVKPQIEDTQTYVNKISLLKPSLKIIKPKKLLINNQ